MAIHVFFDNSNMWGGAQAVRSQIEPGVPWPALRIYYRNLFDRIEGGRTADTRILAGSVPPSCDSLWEFARDRGYRTDLLHRVQRDDGSIGEQGVDEVLHLKIANVLLDFAPPQTLVVATGDGRISEFGTGFSTQIERALRIGWDVELWSWGQSLNERRYRQIEANSGGKMTIHLLDPDYPSVTFVKGGEYFIQDPSGTRTPVTVAARVVQPL
jgi:hypothetical protein